MNKAESLPRPSDRWIPWYIVGFFVLLISVLVPMGIIAVRTNTGVVTENPYEKGLTYNHAIDATRQQQSLQWHSDVTATRSADGQTQVDMKLTDADSQPINNADVRILLMRPTQAGMDQKAPMAAVSSDGHYRSTVMLPVSGLWDATVSVTSGNKNYQIAKRFILP